MIIDARSLGLNSNSSSSLQNAMPTLTEKETEKLVRMLDRAKEKYYDIKQEPLQGGDEQVKAKIVSAPNNMDYIDTSTIKEVKWEFAFETDYSKDKALTNAWVASQNSIFTLMGSSAKAAGDGAVGMDKGEFLDYVRKNGLEKEIIWSDIEKNLVGSKTFDNFKEFTDYTGALFAGLENRIKSDFSGDEQKSQLEIMNGLYEKAVSEFVEEFKHGINELDAGLDLSFSYLGVDVPENKLEASIRGIIDGKRAAYSDYIVKNKDYAGVEDTEDSWLKRDVGFMTSSLKNAFRPTDIQAEDELWSENDLLAIGMLGSMYSAYPAIDKACTKLQNMDEERLGLALSMCWLTTEKLTVDLNVSDDVKGLANGLFEKYAKVLIGDADEALSIARRSPSGAYASAFRSLDQKSVYAVFDVMKKTFEESGDCEKAIYETTSFARNTALSKLKDQEYSKLWRYNKPREDALDANRFWSSFYDTNSKLDYGGAMGKLIKKWNVVDEILKSNNLLDFKQKIGANMFTSFSNPSNFNGPVFGGYSNGKWWGTNLSDLV